MCGGWEENGSRSIRMKFHIIYRNLIIIWGEADKIQQSQHIIAVRIACNSNEWNNIFNILFWFEYQPSMPNNGYKLVELLKLNDTARMTPIIFQLFRSAKHSPRREATTAREKVKSIISIFHDFPLFYEILSRPRVSNVFRFMTRIFRSLPGSHSPQFRIANETYYDHYKLELNKHTALQFSIHL